MAKRETFDKKDIENNQIMAIFSYVFAPLVYYSKSKKKSKWLKFHARQGMNLFMVELIYILLTIILLDKITVLRECTYYLYGISFYCGEENPLYIKVIVLLIGILVLAILISGIVNVLNKKGEKLSLIGNLNLFK